MDIINNRRSIRSYLNKPLEKEKIDLIIRAAMQAPSAINQKPWRFLVITNKEKLDEYSTKASTSIFIKEAPCGILFLIDNRSLKAEPMCYQDMAASVENALLEATNLQIGSCWCGVYPRENRMKVMKEVFNIPDYFIPFALVVLGYPKNSEDMKYIDRYDESYIFYEKF